ncbi:MAG: Na(+)-translocating NADH-quinone reductase subunit A [Bacteroidales bacterium]|nr:Na(+)-translocating NADH-quinone reductase subunit A [Bacteroidales bacterium]
MSETITIKQGLDINLMGEAEKVTRQVDTGLYAIKPTDFTGVFPKVLVQEGDRVKAGTPLFYDKYRETIKLCAPVSGTIKELRRGAKRVLHEIIIEPDTQQVFEDFGKADPNNLTREQITEKMLTSGVWPVIRQRPYNVIANAADHPKSIFISCFDTSPLAPDYNYIINGQGVTFQSGLDALKKLTNGKIHLNLKSGVAASEVFTKAKNVQINYFNGPHPAGNVGVQINKIDPINKGDIVWHLRPQEVLTIGRLFTEGRFNSERIIAITGSEVLKPLYIKTNIGATIREILKDNLNEGKLRFISGNPLTGKKIDKNGFIGFYDSQVTILPEGDYYEMFGWVLPGFGKFSYSRTFFTWLQSKNKKYRLDTNFHGGRRALVMTGEMEKVFPFDIYPMQLIKAIMIEDIEAMENLGIYEVDEEDFALVEYIDTSKTEIQELVRKGLDLMRKEMS